MRLFIAINLPQKTKDALAAYEIILKKCDLDLKWVKPQNLHLTMKFLGGAAQTNIEAIKDTIKNIASGFTPFTATLLDFGFFPNEKKPKVFFIATDKEETLKSIAEALEENLEKIGFTKENKFKPHITLGRFKSYRNIDCLKSAMENISLGEQFAIENIALIKSTLTDSCPVYEEIAKIPLAK